MFRAIEQADLEFLRVWRNAQQHVLRQQHPLTDADQQRWFRERVSLSYHAERPDSLLVMVENKGQPSAYGGLTNIEWVSRRAEVSFLARTDIAGDEVAYSSEFGAFLEWLIEFSFSEVNLRRLFTETWAFRERHMAILEDAGFVIEGRLRRHVVKEGDVHDAIIHGLLESDRGN